MYQLIKAIQEKMHIAAIKTFLQVIFRHHNGLVINQVETKGRIKTEIIQFN
jgi:hypothetical protein